LESGAPRKLAMENQLELGKTHGKGPLNSYKLSNGLINALHFLGIFSLWDARKEIADEVGHSIWKSLDDLG
jgi:hypothetical protein